MIIENGKLLKVEITDIDNGKVILPENVIDIDNYAFTDYSEKIEEIKFNKEIKRVAFYAVFNCKNLRKIDIPKEIDDKVLEQLYSIIQNFNIPANIDENMYGKYIDDVNEMKKEEYFAGSDRFYDYAKMGIFYRRMIKSIGLEETKKMIKFQEVDEKTAKSFLLDDDRTFNELFERKYKLDGDLGIALEMIKSFKDNLYNKKCQEKCKENNIIKLDKMPQNMVELLKKKAEILNQNISEPNLKNIKEIEEKVNNKIKDGDYNYEGNALNAYLNVKKKLGKDWIKRIDRASRSIGYSIVNMPEELNESQLEQFNNVLNMQASEKNIFEIKTRNTAKLKERRNIKQAYELLKSKNLPSLVTYDMLYNMFIQVHAPYNKDFEEFFKENKVNIIEDSNGIKYFSKIHNNFSEIKSFFSNKNISLNIENAIKYIKEKEKINDENIIN